MAEFIGKGVSDGVAKGKLMLYKAPDNEIAKTTVTNTEAQIKRLENARQNALVELRQVYKKAQALMSDDYADIFKAHVLMLENDDLCNAISQMIAADKVSADYATYTTAQKLKATLKKGGMSGSANDIDDVSDCLLRNLRNEQFNKIVADEKVILCADSLVPSQVLEFNSENIAGLCLVGDNHWRHIMIVAKAMKIPAVVGIDRLSDNHSGKMATLDGKTGVLTVDEKA